MDTIDEELIPRFIKSEISADTTSQVAVWAPSSVVIVIVEVPSFNAVTFPLLSTETVLGAELLNFTFLFSAFSGKIEYVNV